MKMAEENQNGKQKPLASELVRGKGTVYFLDIRRSKNDNLYLSLCTSRKKLGGSEMERNCIFIFSDDIPDFFDRIRKLEAEFQKLA